MGTQIVQYAGFVSSQIINCLLLYLLLARANKIFGRYRIIMIFFSTVMMLYSLTEILAFPSFVCTKRSFSYFSNGPLTLNRNIGVPLISVCCGLFGMCLSVLALQFFYRYIVMCRPQKLRYFDGFGIVYAMFPCFLIWIIWTCDVYFIMSPTKETEYIHHKLLMDNFQIDSYKVSFISMLYKSQNPTTGDEHWNWSQVFGLAICCIIMGLCFSTISFCGATTLYSMHKKTGSMSQHTRDLNRQLFLTLSLQTLIPVITMYFPVGSLIVFPFFGIDLGLYANNVGAFVGVYPALDPLLAIFLIKDFRHFVLCRKSKSYKIGPSSNSNARIMSTSD